MTKLQESFSGVRAAVANRDVRLVELAWVGSVVGHYGVLIALAVYAYEEGGALGVGLMSLMRALAAVATPPAAALADRYSRIRVMVIADGTRAALTLVALAVVVAEGPAAIVFACAGLLAMAGAAFRPAQLAVFPTIARTPEELTAANVLATTIEGVGMFAGPALAGLVLALSGVEMVLALGAVAFVWSALLLLPVKAPRPVRHDRVPALKELSAGFALAGSRQDIRLLVTTLSGQALTAGAVNVLIVVVALGLLDLGSGGVGLLDAAVGVGSVIGALAVIPLLTRRALSTPLILGALLWGLPLLVIAARPSLAIAVLALGLVGVGNTLVDVAGFTLLQRIVPDDLLARVFGVVESLFYLMIGAGSLLAPLLVSSLGTREALVVAGLVLPAFVVLAAPRLRRIDQGTTVPEHEVALLREIPMFAPLSELALERLGRRAVAMAVDAGTPVIVQGEEGDRFYAVDYGEFEVRVDGRAVALLGPGDGFGEIALLRDQPRMATVAAVSDGRLYALDRDAFLTAVTGHSDSEEAANALVVSRLNASLGAGVAR